MNTVDMFNVPYSSRKNGRITYQRSKTKDRREDNAEISIKIESEAERLMKSMPIRVKFDCFRSINCIVIARFLTGP